MPLPSLGSTKENAVRASRVRSMTRGYELSEDNKRRIRVLYDTLEIFADSRRRDDLQRLAIANLNRWRRFAQTPLGEVQVMDGDWGEVTKELTMRYGETFAVLNMANAYVPGGGCDDGAIAQEENMYRRSDCRMHVDDSELSTSNRRHYNRETTALVNAEFRVSESRLTPGGIDSGYRVAFDKDQRICIKGPETDGHGGGYVLLKSSEVFCFYELRSAAQDLRSGRRFDQSMARRKIGAQLDTLVAAGQRHVVLSAFGCGAFRNPPMVIAGLYREELKKRTGFFDVVVFAIYYAGYGPTDNFDAFRDVFSGDNKLRLNAGPMQVGIQKHSKQSQKECIEFLGLIGRYFGID